MNNRLTVRQAEFLALCKRPRGLGVLDGRIRDYRGKRTIQTLLKMGLIRCDLDRRVYLPVERETQERLWNEPVRRSPWDEAVLQ